MKRILTYPITESDSDQRIYDFLCHHRYSRHIRTWLKQHPGSVRLNGEEALFYFPLKNGDLLEISLEEEHPSENIVPVDLPIHIIYEDEDLMVIDKSADMPVHPSIGNYENTLANAAAWYFHRQDIPFVFRCINRLDRDTTGLTIIAKHMVSGGILSVMAARREISREYLAIVSGTGMPPEGTVDAPLGRKPGSAIERMVDFEHGERAVTHYRVLQEKNGCSLISLHLETGRTHQIRVHMKYLGYPLIGDFLYYPDKTLISRQALHSCRLEFSHPITGQPMVFTSPLPEDMQQVLR